MKFSVLLISMTLFLIGNLTAQEKVKWYSYSSIEGKARVKFPAEPELKTDAQETMKTFTAMANAFNGMESDLYYLAITVHQAELEDPALLDTSLNAFTRTMGGTIASREEWKAGKPKGLRAAIVLNNQAGKCDYRVLMRGNLQYQVMIVTSSVFNEKLQKKFFKSFKLI